MTCRAVGVRIGALCLLATSASAAGGAPASLRSYNETLAVFQRARLFCTQFLKEHPTLPCSDPKPGTARTDKEAKERQLNLFACRCGKPSLSFDDAVVLVLELEGVSDRVAAMRYQLKLGGASEPSPTPVVPQGAVGGVPAMVSDGLADWVVKRGRAESVGYVFDQINERLCSNAQTKAFFEQLCALSDANEGLGTALVPGRMLQAAIATDLRALPRSLSKHLAGLAADQRSMRNAQLLERNLCSKQQKLASEELAAGVAGRTPAEVSSTERGELKEQLVAKAQDELAVGEKPARTAPLTDGASHLGSPVHAADAPAAGSVGKKPTAPPAPPTVPESRRKSEDDQWDGAASARQERQLLACALRLGDRVAYGIEHGAAPFQLLQQMTDEIQEECACDKLCNGEPVCASPIPSAKMVRTLQYSVRVALGLANAKLEHVREVLDHPSEDVLRAVFDEGLPSELRGETLELKVAFEGLQALVGPALRIRLAIEDTRSKDAAVRFAAPRELIASIVDFVDIASEQAFKAMGDADRTKTYRKWVTTVTGVTRHTLNKEYGPAITQLVASGALDAKREPYRSLYRVSNLVVEVGAARSSADVAAAIEAAAEPMGSWRRRRQEFVFGVSARVGLAAGYERTKGAPSVPNGWVGSLYAPVGVDMSRPIAGGALGFHAWGVMLQALDLGSVVGTRIANDSSDPGIDSSAKSAPKVGFPQVFAPGVVLFGSVGKKTPFVLSLGMSFTPSLRPSGDGGPARDVWRYLLGAAIDLPILMW